MKKTLLFISYILLLGVCFADSGKFTDNMTARPAALKVFTMPKPVTLDTFTRYLDATALGLNIFELTPATGKMAVVWKDGSIIKAVYSDGSWKILFKDPKMKDFKLAETIRTANLTAAFHGTGFVFRTPDKKDFHVYGGFTATGAELYLPASVKTPAIRHLDLINNALLWCVTAEVALEYDRAKKIYLANQAELKKSPCARMLWSWGLRLKQAESSLAKLRSEVITETENYVPVLAADPLMRDRYNWVLWLAVRMPHQHNYFSGWTKDVWYTKSLGRGELVDTLLLSRKLKNIISGFRRVNKTSFNEAYSYKGIIAGGFVHQMAEVPKRSGLLEPLKISADLRGAKGEGESTLLVLTSASQELKDVSVSIKAEQPNAPEARLERLECINLPESPILQLPIAPEGNTDWFDICLPLENGGKFDIEKQTNQPILISLQSKDDTPAAAYKYNVTVKLGGKSVMEMPITFKVENFALGKRIPNLPGLRPDNINSWYTDQKVAFKARRNLIDSLLRFRMDPLNLYRTSPLDDDLEYSIKKGVRGILVDGSLERLGDPRPDMLEKMEFYGSVNGKKFEKVPAKFQWVRREPKDPLSPTDMKVSIEADTSKYKYCKLHYNQDSSQKYSRYTFMPNGTLGTRKRTMLVNGKVMLKEIRLIRPDTKVATTGMDKSHRIYNNNFDVINKTMFKPSLIWKNEVGNIDTLLLYDYCRETHLPQWQEYYNKARKFGGDDMTVYFYGFDEVQSYMNPLLLNAIENSRKAFKNVKIVTTAHNIEPNPELFDAIDYLAPANGYANTRRNMYNSRYHRIRYWTYVGGGAYYPFGNFERVDQPMINSRAFFWSMIALDHVEGWLYWSINHWASNYKLKDMKEMDWSLWYPAHGNDNGMQALFYPGKDGLIYPSLRATAIRDGLEDVDLFRQARDLAKTPADKAEVEAIRNGFARSMSVYCQNIAEMEKYRTRLYNLLAKLTRNQPRVKQATVSKAAVGVAVEQKDVKNFSYHKTNVFHPALAVLKDGRYFASFQEINNSDVYAAPMYSISSDQGKTWSKPQPITPLKSVELNDGSGTVEGFADPRPFVLPDGKVIVIGCATFYKGNTLSVLAKDKKAQKPVEHKAPSYYAIWSPESGQWSQRYTLELPGVDTKRYSSACTQIAIRKDGKIIVPLYVDINVKVEHESPIHQHRFGAMTALYEYKNGKLEFTGKSDILSIPIKRGMCEPSVIEFADNRFAMTIRAEDKNMYCAVSDDGINWSKPQPWKWQDGSAIVTDSTQQHWVRLGKKVFLVYTRNDGSNSKIMRYRAPMYIAEALPEKAQLIKASEKVVFPRATLNGVEALLGNFHCTQIDNNAALVSDSYLFRFNMGKGKDRKFITEVKVAKITF